MYEAVSTHRTGVVAHVVGKIIPEHVNEPTVSGGNVHRGPTVRALGHQFEADRVKWPIVGVPRPYLVLGGPPEVHATPGVRTEHCDPVRFVSRLDDRWLGPVQRTPIDVLEVNSEHFATGHERGVQPCLAVCRPQQHHEQYVPRRRFVPRRLLRKVHGPLGARVRIEHQHRAPGRVRHESVMVVFSGPRTVRQDVLQARRGLTAAVVRGISRRRYIDIERLVRRLRHKWTGDSDYTCT